VIVVVFCWDQVSIPPSFQKRDWIASPIAEALPPTHRLARNHVLRVAGASWLAGSTPDPAGAIARMGKARSYGAQYRVVQRSARIAPEPAHS
jgi:hypothetical protein